MTATSVLSWQWLARTDVAPQAAVAWGAAARRLHQHLAQLDGEQHARLLATANRDVLILLGPTSALPWVDGIEYAAPCEQYPDLWLPTRWQPSVSGDLLANTLAGRYARMPMLLWNQPAAAIPLDRQMPLSREWLARIEAFWAGC